MQRKRRRGTQRGNNRRKWLKIHVSPFIRNEAVAGSIPATGSNQKTLENAGFPTLPRVLLLPKKLFSCNYEWSKCAILYPFGVTPSVTPLAFYQHFSRRILLNHYTHLIQCNVYPAGECFETDEDRQLRIFR